MIYGCEKSRRKIYPLFHLSMYRVNSEYGCTRLYTGIATKGNLMQAVTLLLNLTQLYQTNYKLF